MGKPTIVTDPDGGRDYINDGVDGFLVPPANPREMREKIIFLLQHPEIAREIGLNAKERGASLTTEKHFHNIVRFIENRKSASPEKDS
jgi:glycosyltransferase involved in cell wall biosynthesis